VTKIGFKARKAAAANPNNLLESFNSQPSSIMRLASLRSEYTEQDHHKSEYGFEEEQYYDEEEEEEGAASQH
jgi:hypothetical protein